MSKGYNYYKMFGQGSLVISVEPLHLEILQKEVIANLNVLLPYPIECDVPNVVSSR